MTNDSDDDDDDNKSNNTTAARAERVVKYNEKFNVPVQTEKEEAETHENAEPEHLADDREIERRKKPS
jgi:hypothetical protein